ncbi:protein adenylyltransferase SelO [Paracoccus siganidrum]|uniref:Protein nucleotidyltransferase YdiU n=1 Tax=Paracoccus siganidrum TaxID=1276757 RepID=A0A419A3X7_9RHOB|nr:YdiU family protein [Paracoccus siganidrum]RJL08628.1 YdiU family protein [Paracoccus siganidrum]RMC36765.1 YdiU family protein [Paracoccus siganidrum]
MIHFDNSYARLPEGFFARVKPTPVAEPRLLALNEPLAARLGLDAEWLRGPEGLAMLAGNGLPEGAEPIAQAYAGHQFGGFVPQLGDGRAVLLGEVVAPDGARFDIQLKGSGPTPFSRRGDGRAWLGPVLREYLVSEFMAAMGVPTTRALAAVATGETVWREDGLPGAVLTRVAASHIRVGTFQYFAVRGQQDALAALTDHVIARHYPQANGPLSFLDGVVARQAETIAHWMALGFIHGVMNTDNMAVSGETIDYGPCAFMDGYHPDTVFSSIDHAGRYAWAQQPQIAVWNLAQLATCLIPLMGEREAAIEAATRAVHGFAPLYQAAWLRRFGEKLGLAGAGAEMQQMIEELLTIMARQRADFTRVFAGLADGSAAAEFDDPAPFAAWEKTWRTRDPDPALMAHANPRRIPRNHRIEEAIAAGVAGDMAPFQRLFAAVTHPRELHEDWADLALAPREEQIVRRTFCGT